MEISQQNQIETQSINTEEKPSETERLVKLSLKTLYYSVVLLALFLTLFVLLFPYASMKTYMNMGMRSRALDCADRYYALHIKDYVASSPQYDSKFADVLYAGINLSSARLNEAIAKGGGKKAVEKEAARAEKFASSYLSFPSLKDRTRIADEYSVAHALPSMHASVYSFENTASVLREKARYILNGTGYSLEYFYGAMRADLLLNDSVFELTEESADKYIKLFNELSAIVEYELNELDFYSKVEFSPNGGVSSASVADADFDFDGTEFSMLYLRDELSFSEGGQVYSGVTPILKWASREDLLETDPRGMQYWLPEFTKFVRDYAPQNRADWAKKVFWAKSLADLTERISYAFLVMDCNLEAYGEDTHKEISATSDIWDELGFIETPNGKKSISEWYRFDLLRAYTVYLATAA